MTKAETLDISVEDFLKTNKKGIYFGFTHKNSKEFLNNKIDIEPNPLDNAQSCKEIFKWWLSRWGIQRYDHLKKTNRLKSYDQCIYDIKTQIKNNEMI